MLKIKKDVDLKELEKFGFMYFDSVGQWRFCERNLIQETYIYINVWNRRIIYKQEKDTDVMCLTTIYDLIQANLVEKVEE